MADYLAGFYPEWVDKEENPRQIILDLGKMITNRIPVKLGFQKLNKYDPEYWGLATLLTDEQAEVALKMGVRKPKTMADMVKLTGKSEEELEKILGDMSFISNHRVGIVRSNKRSFPYAHTVTSHKAILTHFSQIFMQLGLKCKILF